MGGILDALSNYNPTAFAQGNQQREATIADTAAQIAQRQAQTAQEQEATRTAKLANQEHVRSLQDTNAYVEALGRNNYDPTKAMQDPLFRKSVSGNGYVGIVNQNLSQQKSLAETKKALIEAGDHEITRQTAVHKHISDVMSGLMTSGAGAPETAAALANIASLGEDYKQEVAQALPALAKSPEKAKDIQQFLLTQAGGGPARTAAETEKALKEKQGAEQEALKNLHEAELPGKQAEGKLAQAKLDLMKAAQKNPEQGSTLIDQALPSTLDPQANASFKAAYQAALGAGSPEAAARIVASAADHAAGLSPAKMQKSIDQKVQEEKALSPIRISQAVQTEVQKAKLAGGLGAIPDPGLRASISRDYDAATKEAADSFTASQNILQNIAEARGGNKVAPNLESLELLRSLVNRVNAKELQAVGTPGNAIDRVSAWLGKETSGQPIPENLQKDFEEVAKGQQALTQRKLALKFAIMGKKANVNLEPPDIAGMYSKISAATPAVSPAAGGVPKVGEMFNGAKVLKIEKIK